MVSNGGCYRVQRMDRSPHASTVGGGWGGRSFVAFWGATRRLRAPLLRRLLQSWPSQRMGGRVEGSSNSCGSAAAALNEGQPKGWGDGQSSVIGPAGMEQARWLRSALCYLASAVVLGCAEGPECAGAVVGLVAAGLSSWSMGDACDGRRRWSPTRWVDASTPAATLPTSATQLHIPASPAQRHRSLITTHYSPPATLIHRCVTRRTTAPTAAQRRRRDGERRRGGANSDLERLREVRHQPPLDAHPQQVMNLARTAISGYSSLLMPC